MIERKTAAIAVQEIFSNYSKLRVSSFADVVGLRGRTISGMVATQGVESVKNILYLIIVDVCNSFNVSMNMTKEQVVSLVNLVETRCGDLKIEDLRFCFDNAKSGKYGNSFHRVDAPTIFGWIDQYKNDKLEWIENNHMNAKSDTGFNLHPDVAQMLDKVISAKKVEDKPLKIVPKTPFEAMIEKEFDEAHREDPVKMEGLPTAIRMIMVDGKKMDYSTYRQYRADQEVERLLSQQEDSQEQNITGG